MKSKWSVAVVYECAEARETATAFCDSLVERFWARFDFDVSWVPCPALEDKASAAEAARKAADADLVVFTTMLQHEPVYHLRQWVETWLRLRGEREGTLVALTTPAPAEGTCPVSQSYFRRIAHRAGMDFSAELPQNFTAIPEGPESYPARASEVTSVLDAILHQHRPPPDL